MEAVDTKDLQWASVVACSRATGWEFDEKCGNFKDIYSGATTSVTSAVLSHNWLNNFDRKLSIDKRLVKRVKLQWHKRSKTLICQSHKVEFCDGVNPEDYL